MLIADAQVHIWGPDTAERPWKKGAKPHRPVPLGADALIAEMNAAGVQRAVLVPPSFEGTRDDLVLDAAARYPGRFAAMGKIDPADPAARDRLAGWRGQQGMLGLRFNFKKRPETLTEERMAWVWGAAETAGVPVYLGVTHTMLPAVDAIAAKHPGLKIILDHLALAGGIKDDEAFSDIGLLIAIATRQNVAVKASALPCYSTAPYPFRNLHGYLRQVFDAFGPRRMMWGSDLTRLKCSYRECVTLFTEELPWLSAGDLEWIMGRSLSEWLGWPLDLGMASSSPTIRETHNGP
jgi:L-fuconolactonase